MKQFIMKSSFLVVSLLAIVFVQKTIFSQRYSYDIAADVYQVIEWSHKSTEYRKVILGDSVTRQIFPPETQADSDYYHLASNQAISMLGQYIILENYLKNNASHTDEVVLIMVPWGLSNNLDQPWTFNYVLLPFFSEENESYISDYALTRIKRNPYYFLSRIKLLRYFAVYMRIDYSEVKGGWNWPDQDYLSPLSIEYIKRMNRLCNEYNIAFRILPGPLSDKTKNKDYSFMIQQTKDNGLHELFAEYFQRFSNHPNEAFQDDGYHLKNDYLEKNVSRIIEDMGLNASRRASVGRRIGAERRYQ
jgi:hypothetical protein